MERRTFVKRCCYSVVAIPLAGAILPSCGTIHYASATRTGHRLSVAKSEFVEVKKGRHRNRNFVLLEIQETRFPVCLYKMADDHYEAALMQCTHRGCELNVGGGIYSCPCHGSEFSVEGNVMEGPADRNLRMFNTETDETHVHIFLA